MPPHRRKLKRVDEPGHARYLTCSCYHQLALFNNDKIKSAFADHLASVKSRLGFRLYAWVVMPEHFHLLIHPTTGGASVTAILRKLKSDFAMATIARWRELDAPILPRITTPQETQRFWQAGGGYDRNVFSESELTKKIAYTHLNPVRRGLVSQPEDWEWSSVRAYLRRGDGVGPPIDPIH